MLSFVRALANAFSAALDHLGVELGAQVLQRALDVQVRVPDLEVVHHRKARHRGAVFLYGVEHDSVLVLDSEIVVARGDQHAHGQALDIPLPRPGERLVEVVEVEHQFSLGRGEHAEVRQVRVAAALNLKPRAWRRGEVTGHDQRCAPIEREG